MSTMKTNIEPSFDLSSGEGKKRLKCTRIYVKNLGGTKIDIFELYMPVFRE